MAPAKIPTVAIDGLAGTGKSSVAKALARLMVFDYRDTGAEYRAVGVVCSQLGVDLEDAAACGVVAERFIAGFHIPKPGHIIFDGQDLSQLIRTPEGGMSASRVAVHQPVRRVLTAHQRTFALKGRCVIEGRDAGTAICPEAVLKVYLNARPEVRAARRHETAVEALERRDRLDTTRAASPLEIAEDAERYDSSDASIDTIAKDLHDLYKRLMYAR